MYKFSFVHEDTRIVWAIRKLLDLINNVAENPVLPVGDLIIDTVPDNTVLPTDNQMVGMAYTLGPGTWIVTFSGDVGSSGAVPNTVQTSIYVGGSQIPGSVRTHQFADTDLTASFASFVSQAKVIVSPSGSVLVQGRWSVTAGQTATSLNRQLSFVQVKP